jgi:uncharacterized iron-regulated membrane protein
MATVFETASASTFYRAVWRWHFIAGLLVLPFLVLLAVTGGLYLFSPELDHLVYRSWDRVAADGPTVSAATLAQRVEQATGGQVLQLFLPQRQDRAVRMTVYLPQAGTRTAFVDPHDGRVLGTTRFGGVMQIVRKVHSLQYFGPAASWVMEAAAGWAIVLVATGVFLWWPRGRNGGVVSVRGRPGERVFWRDTHAVTGVFAGIVIVFLAVTGMPWSDVWGGKVQELATHAGLNRPDPPAEVVPDWQLENFVPKSAESATRQEHGHHHGSTAPKEHDHHHGAVAPALPWALEKASSPQSQPGPDAAQIDIDRAVGAIDRAGLPKPYSITLPQGPAGAFVATYTPDKVEDLRVVYIDQYDGHVLDDVGYARFGSAAKVIEWGIAVHQGQQFGSINRYVMLAGCIAIVVLAVSSLTMWWKRRPKSSLGLPPAPADARVYRWLIAIIAPLALFYPLVGASLVIALLLDAGIALLVRLRTPPLPP